MALTRTDAENLKAHVEGMCWRIYDQMEHVERMLAEKPDVLAEVEDMYGKDKLKDVKDAINRGRALMRAVEHHKAVATDLQ